jgi:PAS domain S-box-containing protein
MRVSGLDIIGDVPWGTHFCQFYQDKQDLIDTLVPYFAAGLAGHEFCMWITSEPLQVEEAKAAMRAAVPCLDDFLAAGQIKFLDYTEWYTVGGEFDADRVLAGWVRELEAATARGFEGLRLTGNTFWLEQAAWSDFTQYEAAVDSVIARYRMLAMCTYSLQRCGAAEIMDVMSNHLFALIKRGGAWQVIESAKRREIEASLRASEERYRSLFNGMTEGFALHEIVCNAKGEPVDYRFLDINPAFERLTGLPRLSVVGRLMSEVLPQEDPAWIDRYGRVALTGEPVHFDNYAPVLQRHYEVYAYRPAPRQFAVIFVDVTEQKRTEARLAEANRLKDEFLATLSHELRTPLNAIIGWSDLLSKGQLNGDAAARAIEIIARNARVQAQLVSDVLDVSRIVSGKLRLAVKAVDLAAVVRDALEVVQPAADAKGIDLGADLDPAALQTTIAGDPDRLQQVLWNLLANAVKFTPAGGVIVLSLRRSRSHLEFAVQDTGTGIAPDFLPHVFERFRQADSSPSRQHPGLGIGLAIVRHLVELHGGTVRAESQGPGRGATFTVSLPVRATPFHAGTESLAADPDAPPPAAEAREATPLDGITVLAVDDEADAREWMRVVLEATGATVLLAASAPEALSLAAVHFPDVVLSDIGMPGQDGYEFLGRLRAMEAPSAPPVPAVALTAYGRREDRQRALAAGYQLHLPKPLLPEELVAAVTALAGGPARPRA